MSFTAALSTPSNHSAIDELVDRLGSPRPVLLAIWAHPDDESMLGAGLIGEVARRGGRVVNVSATLGEHGTSDARLNPPHAVAARRRRELDAALNQLGVALRITLGYADGGCDQIPDLFGAERLRSIIDDVQPDAVLSFGDDGVTGHPDHIAVARWTEHALDEQRESIPLLATAASVSWHDSLIEQMHLTGAFWPGYPTRTVDGPIWSVRLDGEALDQKLAALACHPSQMEPLQTALGTFSYRTLASAEAYRPVNPAAQRRFATQRVPVAA